MSLNLLCIIFIQTSQNILKIQRNFISTEAEFIYSIALNALVVQVSRDGRYHKFTLIYFIGILISLTAEPKKIDIKFPCCKKFGSSYARIPMADLFAGFHQLRQLI